MSTWEKGRATRNNINPPTTSQPLPTHTRTLARSRGIQLASSRASPSLPPVGGGGGGGLRVPGFGHLPRLPRERRDRLALSLSLSVCAGEGAPSLPASTVWCGVCQGGARALGAAPPAGGRAGRKAGPAPPPFEGGEGGQNSHQPEPERTDRTVPRRYTSHVFSMPALQKLLKNSTTGASSSSLHTTSL